MVGAVIIICGLYSVLWGKSKEIKKKTRIVPNDIEISGGEKAGETVENFNYANAAVFAMAPNVVPDPDPLPIFEENQDLEDNVSKYDN